MKKNIVCYLFVICHLLGFSQEKPVQFNTPGAGNPIIPGYFADPTVKKIGDTYYIYATTDGNGGGLGPSQVWTSKDFVNWSIQPMNWPSTHFIWAPDVMEKDGKYYLYYCQPCQIYCGVSGTPVGPWENILGTDDTVLVPDHYVKMSITLDGQTFVDDDGSVYLYWGTWGIYPGHGCGVGKFNPDMKTFSDTTLIPNTQAVDFFEAPFVFKRNGIYYFMYSSGSCHDHTYRVQYATSKVGPMGPFEFADNNPILETSADKTIHGPGHHSIFQEGDNYYIVYHRHDIPNSTRGMHRQIAADRLTFDREGRIEKIKAGHEGVGYLQSNSNPYPNLVFGKKVKASSFYNDSFKPEYAVDDNNATLWRPVSCGEEWIVIDLEKPVDIKRVWTQFEYATSFYQYLIETSDDEKNWKIFSDKRNNTLAGSPMIDAGSAKARYLRLTVTGNEKNGLSGSIWNLKVFGEGKDPFLANTKSFNGQKTSPAPKRKGLLFEINASDYPVGASLKQLKNSNDSTMVFTARKTLLPVRLKEGKYAFSFDGTQDFRSNFRLPETMTGSSPYTVIAWILMDELHDNECMIDLIDRGGELEKISVGYGSDKRTGIVTHNGGYEDMGIPDAKATGKWQQLAVTFDGYMEKIYIDGTLVKEKDIVLRLPQNSEITLGRKSEGDQPFKNYLHSLTVYDDALDANIIAAHYNKETAGNILFRFVAADCDYNMLNWRNEGNAGGLVRNIESNNLIRDVKGKIALTGALTVNEIHLPGNKSIEAVSIDFLHERKSYDMIRWNNLSIKNESKKIEIQIQNENIEIDLKTIPSGSWNQLFLSLSKKHITVYLNNKKVSETTISQFPSLTDSILLGDPEMRSGLSSGISGVTVYSNKMKEADIYRQYMIFTQKVLLQQSPELHAKAISPEVIRLQANKNADGTSYLFENLTTQTSSGWINEPEYLDVSLQMGKTYQYNVRVKDNYGNVIMSGKPVIIQITDKDFTYLHDDFSVSKNIAKSGISGTIWSGLDGYQPETFETVSVDGKLHLSSSNRNFRHSGEDNGPLLYCTVKNDFMAEVEIVDFSGMKDQKGIGYNEGGLMIFAGKLPGEDQQTALHLGVFPHYDIGNLLTDLSPHQRPQFPNRKGWNLNRYLQVEKNGSKFYFRTSSDGKNWENMPGSPFTHPELDQIELKVGLYQATYTNNKGYVDFDHFRLWIQKRK